MRIVGVDGIHHFLRIVEFGIQELHRVPQVIVPPVLPVLYYAVEWHSEFAVTFHHLGDLLLAFVAFAALPETIGPQWEHGDLTCEVPHLGNHAVGIIS